MSGGIYAELSLIKVPEGADPYKRWLVMVLERGQIDYSEQPATLSDLTRYVMARGLPYDRWVAYDRPIIRPWEQGFWDRNIPARAHGGLTYFVEAVGAGAIKIGYSRDLSTRIVTLQTASPVPLRIAATLAGPPSLEQKIHCRFMHLRTHGEWFSLAPELIAFMQSEAQPWNS